MGGVEYAVPIGIAILLYLLFPAFLKNRQRRLLETMAEELKNSLIRVGEVSVATKYFTIPAALGLTSDFLIIHHVLTLFRDEIPLERLRYLEIQHQATKTGSHYDNEESPAGNILIIVTTEGRYRLVFELPEDAYDWKRSIENAV